MRLSLDLVGGGVYDAPFQRAVDKRQPLQRLLSALGPIVGVDAHIDPRLSIAPRMLTAA